MTTTAATSTVRRRASVGTGRRLRADAASTFSATVRNLAQIAVRDWSTCGREGGRQPLTPSRRVAACRAAAGTQPDRLSSPTTTGEEEEGASRRRRAARAVLEVAEPPVEQRDEKSGAAGAVPVALASFSRRLAPISIPALESGGFLAPCGAARPTPSVLPWDL